MLWMIFKTSGTFYFKIDIRDRRQGMKYSQDLKQIIYAHPVFLHRLKFLREINPSAYLSAGVIRNMVWSVLHDQHYLIEQTEIDVIFYDTNAIEDELQRLTQLLSQKFPENTWDVVNQAFVHTWYTTDDGRSVAQYSSLAEALATWPETATAIAVRLLKNDDLEIIAPFGLNDLFELKLRWNDCLVSHGVFLERVQSKRFFERWNRLEIID